MSAGDRRNCHVRDGLPRRTRASRESPPLPDDETGMTAEVGRRCKPRMPASTRRVIGILSLSHFQGVRIAGPYSAATLRG